MNYCASCGCAAQGMCECLQRRCNAPSSPDEKGAVYHCERQLHHRGRCAARRPDQGPEAIMAWHESAAQLYEDLGMQIDKQGNVKGSN